MMRDNRNVSYGSQCHFNPIFRYLCKGGDYDISNEKAFLGPDYTCDYWGATHRHTQTHNSFVKSPDSYYLQAGPGPTAPCKTTGLSDSIALTHSLGGYWKFWLPDWKLCDKSFACVSSGRQKYDGLRGDTGIMSGNQPIYVF